MERGKALRQACSRIGSSGPCCVSRGSECRPYENTEDLKCGSNEGLGQRVQRQVDSLLGGDRHVSVNLTSPVTLFLTYKIRSSFLSSVKWLINCLIKLLSLREKYYGQSTEQGTMRKYFTRGCVRAINLAAGPLLEWPGRGSLSHRRPAPPRRRVPHDLTS